MNAKDQAALTEVIAQMQTEFAATLKAALRPLADEMVALTQRSSNFAARVSSHNACYRAEIKALREQVLALEARLPRKEVRVPHPQWIVARDDLRLGYPGKSFTAAQVRDHAVALADGSATAYVAPEVPSLAETDDEVPF